MLKISKNLRRMSAIFTFITDINMAVANSVNLAIYLTFCRFMYSFVLRFL